MHLQVREIQHQDIPLLADYWYKAPPEYLTGMGVDLDKFPSREAFVQMLEKQIVTPVEEKASYALIWEVDHQPAGHSNINQITFGEKATMHVHLWQPQVRKKGIGTELVKLSLPFYFEKFRLRQLICEPFAGNPAPHRTLEKAGFKLEKQYRTIPGPINLEQEVKRWVLTRAEYEAMASSSLS